MQNIARSLTFKQLSIKQRMLKVFRISYLRHIYRAHIKANLVSIIYKYTFTKSLLRRYQDYRQTKKSYKGLKNSIRLKVKIKKIVNAWSNKKYSVFFQLGFVFIFAWPIWLIKKANNAYLWLEVVVKIFIQWIKKLFNSIEVSKK